MPSYTQEESRRLIERFHELRDGGVPYRDAAQAVGISTATAQKWTKRFGLDHKQDLERRVSQMDRRLRELEEKIRRLEV